MTELGRACCSGLVMTDGGGASAVGAAAGAALSRSDALSPVADATVAASLVGDGSKTQRIGVVSTVGRSGHAQTGRCHARLLVHAVSEGLAYGRTLSGSHNHVPDTSTSAGQTM